MNNYLRRKSIKAQVGRVILNYFPGGIRMRPIYLPHQYSALAAFKDNKYARLICPNF